MIPNELPFDDGVFERAYMLHVGMNLADKARAFREVRRVVKAGGMFAVYDMMRVRNGAMRYPAPWARRADDSFLEDVAAYRAALAAAGFTVVSERDRREFGIAFVERGMERMASATAVRQMLMGDEARVMLTHVLEAMREGVIAPVEMLARA